MPTCYRCPAPAARKVWNTWCCEEHAQVAERRVRELMEKLFVPDEEFEDWLRERGTELLLSENNTDAD